MQVILRIFRARQRPIVFFAPLVFSHHENLHRLFFLDAVRFSFQQPVIPPKHQFIAIDWQFLCKVHRADFSVVPTSRVPPNVYKQPLPVPRRFRARSRFQTRVIFQRAAQKNVVPRAHV